MISENLRLTVPPGTTDVFGARMRLPERALHEENTALRHIFVDLVVGLILWKKLVFKKTRTPMNLPEEELFKNLEEIWIKLGRQPRYAEVQKPLSKYHVGTYENRFGGWRNALEKFVAYINN